MDVYLWPVCSPPVGWARRSVTRPSTLRLLSAAVLAVNRPVGPLVEELHTANCSDLETKAAAGLRAIFPLFRDPPRTIQTRIDHWNSTRTSWEVQYRWTRSTVPPPKKLKRDPVIKCDIASRYLDCNNYSIEVVAKQPIFDMFRVALLNIWVHERVRVAGCGRDG